MFFQSHAHNAPAHNPTNPAAITTLQTLPPGYLVSIFAPFIAQLSLPTFLVGCWAVDHAFFCATAFGWDAFGELALPLGSCIFAASIFLSRNPMHALLALLAVCFSTVLLYLMAGIAFVGLVFLIVYVGAVAVLFLFVIMLLNVKSLTPTDTLVQHTSQFTAIAATALLLQQLHQHLTGAAARAVSDNLMCNVAVEPTTADAVYNYVRFQAMDINALVPLYTVHAVLFLVTTAILLAALLGAIILATVTTERATSIYDIRRYSTEARSSVIAPLLALVVLLTFGADLFPLLDRVSGDVGPVFMSALIQRDFDKDLWHKNQKQWELRLENTLEPDARYPRAHKRPLASCKVTLRARAARKVRGNKRCAIRGLNTLLRRNTLPAGLRHRVLASPRLPRLLLQGALTPICEKLTTERDTTTIVRDRWLWRWRRDRATSLFRLDRTFTDYKAPRPARVRVFARRVTVFLLSCWYYLTCVVGAFWLHPQSPVWDQTRTQWLATRIKSYTPRPTAAMWVHPADPMLIRLPRVTFYRSPLRFLRFQYRIHISPRLLYWAWRIRAFCVLFFFYLALVSILSALLQLLFEDPISIFYGLRGHYSAVYAAINNTLAGLTAPSSGLALFPVKFYPAIVQSAPTVVSAIALLQAALIVLPVALLSWIVTHASFICALSVVMAFDAVLTHGGELSDLEFYEARCEFWRKEGWAHVQRELDRLAAEALEYSRRHPDKGRIDVVYPFWLRVTAYDWSHNQHLPTWPLKPFFWWYDVRYYLQNTSFYQWLASYIHEYYAGLARVAVFAWEYWCREGWSRICAAFDRITFPPYPYLGDVLPYFDACGLTVLLYAVLLAAALYYGASALLHVNWHKMYYGTPIQRPRLLVHLFLLLPSLYALAVFYTYFAEGLHLILGHPEWRLNLFQAYSLGEFPRAWADFQFVYGWVFLSCAIWYALCRTRTRGMFEAVQAGGETRRWLDTHTPVTLRAYFNIWSEWCSDFEDENHDLFLEEGEYTFGLSAADASAHADAVAAEVVDAQYRKEQARLLHFILVMRTFIPTYYDKHPEEAFQNVPYPGAYFSDKLHDNAFISK